MKVIANKTNLYNDASFLNESLSSPLSGVSFNIAITKDNQFVVFSPISNNDTTIQTINNKNLQELKHLDLLTLDYVLNFYQTRKNNLKIFLNLISATIPIDSDEALESLKNLNENYANRLLTALLPYQSLNIYIASVNIPLIQKIKDKKTFGKIGVILYGGNLNYIDVDYYIFSTALLSDEIFKQQLDLNKEVILYLGTSNDLSIAFEHFRGEKSTALAHSIFNDIYFLNDYPNLFYQLFKEKS